jgi:hypothetical protein
MLRQGGVLEWENEQFESDRVQTTNDWRGLVPLDPQPGDVFEELSVLAPVFQEQHEAYLLQRDANLIPNVLRDLVIPLSTPEVETDE